MKISFKMKAAAFSRLLPALALAVVVWFSLAGCDIGSDPAEFSGRWDSSDGDAYVIDAKAKTIDYLDLNGYGMEWSGTIVGDVANDATLLRLSNGYIIAQVTSAGSWGPPVGKFVAVHWKDLTSSSVQAANAYKAGGSTGESSAAAAKAEFTVENGYFTMYGTYTPQ
jgi:hypothetical protein